MTETKTLPDKYDAKTREKFWQNHWKEQKIFSWKNDLPKDQTFVIDTPPPTVSGLLHMGHVFSYTQADFVARFQRMIGKDAFYPMGFDDNGLPTERLVEKIIGKKAGVYEAENGHGSFVAKCREVVKEAEVEFEVLFNSIALSVDWDQKYQTISPESQKISQASFLDLHKKGLVEKKFEPVFWDISDRTALAQADLIDKEVEGVMNEIEFSVCHSREGGNPDDLEKIIIMTTRPELLPACVAVMVHPDDERYKKFHGSYAITPLFGVKVKIIPDDLVQLDKGTGAVMCCTFGDETDIRWWKKHSLQLRVIIGQDGKMSELFAAPKPDNNNDPDDILFFGFNGHIKREECLNLDNLGEVYKNLVFGKNIKQAKDSIIEALKNTQSNHESGKGFVTPSPCSLNGHEREDGFTNPILLSSEINSQHLDPSPNHFAMQPSSTLPQGEGDRQSLLVSQTSIKRPVKCAERSGVPIEILVVPQWFIKILDKKDQLKAKAAECNWYPEYMKVRIDQWIDGLQWDWCISRQRFFGVAFPVWYSKRTGEEGKILVADVDQLPCDPNIDLPKGYSREEVTAETDIMDTWMTSSVSPQLSSRGISAEMDLGNSERHEKLFPADLRPQAHEIIRTWAFYTLTKAVLHQNSIPWKNLMISGWCLAADKTKMSKSKGNVVTPTSLIEEKGSDIVRYWASTSHLGADTAYSEEVFKIGQKLITKLFNAAKFASMNFSMLNCSSKSSCHSERSEESHDVARDPSAMPQDDKKNVQDDDKGNITEAADLWILSRLQQTVKRATDEFEKFEYARAREAIEEFFWKDLCDNYLEICKVRSYGLVAEKIAGVELTEAQKSEVTAKQQSAILTLRICLNTILKLFSPFIPHICDEIYSTIFAEEFAKTGSINARGNWPKISEEYFNQKFFDIGEAALSVIFEVRKFKSEQNISMKTTVKKLVINCEKDLSEIAEDLKNVCNAEELEFVKVGQLVEVVL
jgi:valyl-tRNA synthetase